MPTPPPPHTHLAPSNTTPRQEELVDHALALVRESGLPGLTVRRLAERVGFTEAALYRHFASKQELLLALMHSLGERLLVPVRRIAADTALPVEARLKAILRHHVKLVLDAAGLPVLIVAEAAAAGDEPMLARIRTIMGEYLGILTDLLAAVPPAVGFRRPPPSALGLLLLGLPAASALRLRILPDDGLEAIAREELVDFLVDRLLAGDGSSERGGRDVAVAGRASR